jgi:hypothetical protein
MHAYERWILRRYLANALRSSHFAKPPRADGDIVAWIESHARLLGLPELAARAHSTRRRASVEAPMHLAGWKAWRAAVIGMARAPAPNPSPLQKRLDWLAKACSLTQSQNSALGLLARATQTPQFRSLVEAVNDRPVSTSKARTASTFIPSWKRNPSGSNSALAGGFPNWV